MFGPSVFAKGKAGTAKDSRTTGAWRRNGSEGRRAGAQKGRRTSVCSLDFELDELRKAHLTAGKLEVLITGHSRLDREQACRLIIRVFVVRHMTFGGTCGSGSLCTALLRHF